VKSSTKTHLVEATSPRSAIAYLARNEFKADIPVQHEIFAMAKAGIEIELATDEPISDETRNAVAQTDLVVESAEPEVRALETEPA
jgi:hypothetical protein